MHILDIDKMKTKLLDGYHKKPIIRTEETSGNYVSKFLWIPKDDAAAIKMLAKERGVTQNSLYEMAVKSFLSEYELQQAVDNALKAVRK